MFERFHHRSKKDTERSKIERRSKIEARALEHNSIIDLAQQKRRDAITRMLEMDVAEVKRFLPIIYALTYAERVETTALWVTSIVESDGDIMKAWDRVDQRIQDKHDFVNKLIDDSNASKT